MCAFSMGVGMFMLMALLINDIQINLKSIDKCLKSKQKRLQITKQYTDTIHFHSVVKQLSKFLQFA